VRHRVGSRPEEALVEPLAQTLQHLAFPVVGPNHALHAADPGEFVADLAHGQRSPVRRRALIVDQLAVAVKLAAV
jgi:hypothetical protein